MSGERQAQGQLSVAGFSLTHYSVYSFRPVSLSTHWVAGSVRGAGGEAVQWTVLAVPALTGRMAWPSIPNLPQLPTAQPKATLLSSACPLSLTGVQRAFLVGPLKAPKVTAAVAMPFLLRVPALAAAPV